MHDMAFSGRNSVNGGDFHARHPLHEPKVMDDLGLAATAASRNAS